jgi:pimeloyl-ACP methyl ester carboxylesterase
LREPTARGTVTGVNDGCAEIDLHGRRVRYQRGGKGPLIVLLHGIAGSSATWRTVIPRLASHHTVIAPDLLGHGESAKPRGDYSLGAYASLLRDLLEALELGAGTIVGHSLGGGVALQFSYQFPDHCERLVLVSSGGLGREVHPILRAAVLPGAELVLPWLASGAARGIGTLTKAMGRMGFRESSDLGEAWRSFVCLEDAEARRVFLCTVRSVIDLGGQRVSAADKLYLAEGLPTMIVWGDRDPLIPVDHARRTHELIRGSRLEIFPGAGHYPYLDDPDRFATRLLDFIGTTTPASLGAERLRSRLKSGPPSAPRAGPTTPPAGAPLAEARAEEDVVRRPSVPLEGPSKQTKP